jgi:alkyl sulfatase BDS1-like metallo-beta-lactamase superfamily hydrolase
MSMTATTSLPFRDTADFDNAGRGFIATGESVIRNDAGEVIWDNGSYTDY